MHVRESMHGSWTSRWTFILAATGAVVGLGNIWTFPYTIGMNGGGAFVLVYLACLILIGVPIMIAALALGRRARHSPVNSMFTLAIESGHSDIWRYLGFVCVFASLLFLSYYSVISGWAIYYAFLTGSGQFTGITSAGVKARFFNFIQDPVYLLMFHTLFMMMTMYVVSVGVRGGLEKAAKIMVPVLLVLLVVLDLYAFNTNSFAKAFEFLLDPDFSRLSWEAVLIAMEHAFFTLSLGMGVIMVYGAYMPQRVSITQSSLSVAGIDTLVTLLVGLAVFPLIFSGGLKATSGTDLLFLNLPLAFGQLHWSVLFGTLFYLMIIFAAWTSSIALLEPAVAWLIENHGFKRFKATFFAGTIVWALGIFTVFSFNKWQFRFSLFGHIHQNGFFDVFDQLTTKIMLPLAGILIALFAGWFMSREASRDELEMHDWLYASWRFLVRYISPFAMLVVFLTSIGVIKLS
ncbi:MAG: sodium-dependent transporter [Gammaproteobacteria bacterium]